MPIAGGLARTGSVKPVPIWKRLPFAVSTRSAPIIPVSLPLPGTQPITVASASSSGFNFRCNVHRHDAAQAFTARADDFSELAFERSVVRQTKLLHPDKRSLFLGRGKIEATGGCPSIVRVASDSQPPLHVLNNFPAQAN